METRGQMDQKPLISQTERKTSQVELSFEQLLKKREEGDAPAAFNVVSYAIPSFEFHIN